MKISISRFKQLEKIEMDVGNITLLVGGNNSGKSSILQGIQFGVAIAQATSLINTGWGSNKLATSLGQNQLIYLPIKDVAYLAKNGELKTDKDKGICIRYEKEESYSEVVIRKGKNKNVSINIEGADLGKKLQSINEPFSMLVTGLAGIPNEERYQTPFVVNKSAAIGYSNSVFRNILLLLKKNEQSWSVFNKEVRSIFPEYEVYTDFDENKNEFINCWVSKGDGIKYPIDSCGTGILQTIQILSYIYLFKPSIILLDEPDSHLHPNNQILLANRLIEISRKTNTRIIVATHSKHLVSGLINDANLLWLSNGVLQDAKDKHLIESLIEIGALDAGQRLSPPKWVLLTEDTDTNLLITLIITNDAKLEDGEILSYNGCTKIETAQILLKHLKDKYPTSQFIIHRERDFIEDENIIKYKNNFNNVKFLIPELNDIESCFISYKHIASSCDIPEDKAQEIIHEVFDNHKADLIKKYVNVKKQNYEFKEQSNKAGELAAEAHEAFKEYNPSVIHGKEMLKLIRRKLEELKITDNINSVSEDLKRNDICDLFK